MMSDQVTLVLGLHDEHENPRQHDRHIATRARSIVPRLALTPEEAAAALGMGRTTFREHVDSELRWVRRGRKRVCPVGELERWLEREAERLPSC